MLGTEFGRQFPIGEHDEVVEFTQPGDIAKFLESMVAQGLKVSRRGAEARFFTQFPEHRLERGFTRLKMATKKIPAAWLVYEVAALAEEELTGLVAIDEGPGTGIDIHGLWLNGRLRNGSGGG